jgi:RNA polymerase II subunit A-like phosphatase
MTKIINLGSRLAYPITIVKLFGQAGQDVNAQQLVMQYSIRATKEVGDHVGGNTWRQEQIMIMDWDSPVKGLLQKWLINEGDVITRDRPCFEVKEPCGHEIQFQGLCAVCGQDMTQKNWAAEKADTARAPVNMIHDQTSLTISTTQARRFEQELQRRLLEQRKLSLVVDLDQTIIHACIDPTVGEWQRDPSNPNYESVKEVRSFQLNDDGPRGLTSGSWYYIKMRPGLERFLQNVQEMYELHVYTMGTRTYAQNIAKLVDPEQKLFGNRVISRDESGSMTAKSLQRLFPESTNMVVIIDDRADVWPRNRDNLIKVTPYDFFKGIGDINSSFLPKRADILAPSPIVDVQTPNETIANGTGGTDAKSTNGDKLSALDEFVSMGGDNEAVKRQLEEQEKTLEQQIKDRPLSHLQEQLDKEDEEAEQVADTQNGGDATPVIHHPRHHVLLDDDHELSYLEEHLTQLHQTYYAEYDANQSSSQSHHEADPTELASVPDVAEVLPTIKRRVLRGTKIVLSGIIPHEVNVRKSEIGLQLKDFGASLRETVTKDITHLVVSSLRSGTPKAKQAASIPSIKIVNQDWLTECFTQWKKVDETPYLMQILPAQRVEAQSADASAETSDAEDVSDADDVDMNAAGGTSKSKVVRLNTLKLKIVNAAATVRGENGDGEAGQDDEEFDPSILPRELEDGETSPVEQFEGFDWGSVDDDLDEFLREDGDDDDDEDEEEEVEEGGEDNQDKDDTQGENHAPSTSKKRKHDDKDDDEADTEVTDSESGVGLPGDDEPSFAKKQRLARSRGYSSLRAEFVNSDDAVDGSLPTPQVTGDEDDVMLLKPDGEENDGDDEQNIDESFDFDDDVLEAELLAELEADDDGGDGDVEEKG